MKTLPPVIAALGEDLLELNFRNHENGNVRREGISDKWSGSRIALHEAPGERAA